MQHVLVDTCGELGVVLPFPYSPCMGCSKHGKPPPAPLNLREDGQNPTLQLVNSGLSKAEVYNSTGMSVDLCHKHKLGVLVLTAQALLMSYKFTKGSFLALHL